MSTKAENIFSIQNELHNTATEQTDHNTIPQVRSKILNETDEANNMRTDTKIDRNTNTQWQRSANQTEQVHDH